MFATLLNPRNFSPTLHQQIELVRQLVGPFFSDDASELRVARDHGLQTALVIADRPGITLADAVSAGVAESAAEIIAIRTSALASPGGTGDERVELLIAALRAAEGRHRMLIAVDQPLAAWSAAAWRALPFESLLFDPIGDPDGWRAAATLPGECGLILSLVAQATEQPVEREVLLWGLRYAASLGGRGGARVGFTERTVRFATDEAGAGTECATATIQSMLDLLRLTGASQETLERELDPRSISPAARRKGHGGERVR